MAFRYHLSPEALKELNAKVKRPEQLNSLQGQWVIVPVLHDLKREAVASDNDANPFRDRMAAVWGSAQHNGAGDAVRDSVNSAANAALTEEVESWLSHGGGKARVTADVGIGSSDSRDVGIDYLWPIKEWQDDIIFTQMSFHRWNDRNILNLGLGWRHNISANLLAGSNVFFDQDMTRHHNRVGIGGELWSNAVRTSANYYIPLSGWRESNDTVFNDDPERYKLYERAARGWDMNVETALSQHISAKVGWFQWYGDKVDVNGSRSEASRDPHGLNLGLNWQPIPLVGVSAEQSFISGQSDNFSIGLNFNWEFGRRLSEMLSPDNATALPSLAQSRTEFVNRNNNIVLAYKQVEKDRRLYFSPTERSTQAGVPLLHVAKGGQGGVIHYSSSNPTTATVDEQSGQVNPKLRGEVAITATETSPLDNQHVLSHASYHLTITPGDFAPSVTDVAIAGDVAVGNTLKGSYLYVNNQGEDEDTAKTVLRWIDKNSGKVLKEGSADLTVSADDMSKTLIFQVTPVNKKGVSGEPGEATVSGSATLTALRIDHLLTPGEVRPDGSVKFFAENNGSLLLLAEVKDGKGEPLADQKVYWQSQNALGNLSQNEVRTDKHGQALVKMTGIMDDGKDMIVASLTPTITSYSATQSNDDVLQESMSLVVDFSKALSMSFTQAPQEAEVATEQTFAILITDQDGEPLTVPQTVTWKSNDVAVTGSTDNEGKGTLTLPAPQKVADGWEVSAEVGEVKASADPVTLVAGAVSKIELDVPSTVVAGSTEQQVTANLYDRWDNPVINRKQAIDWQINGSQFSPEASGDSDEHGQVHSQVVVPTLAPTSVQVSAGKETKTMDVVVGTVARVAVSSTPDTLTANETNTAQLTATAWDAHDNVVKEADISWTLETPERGTLSQQSGQTDSQGKGTATFTTKKTGGEAKVSVNIAGKTDTATIALNGIPQVTSVTLDKTQRLKVKDTISVASVEVEQNGSGETEMSWQWLRDGMPISGATDKSYTLTEADTGAQLVVLAYATNDAGNRGGKASSKTEKVIGLVDKVTVRVVDGSINADGSSEMTFIAEAVDKNSVPVPDEKIGWQINHPELITLKSADEKTGDDGKGTYTLTAKHTGGNLRLTADIGSKSGVDNAVLKGIPVITSVTLDKTAGLKVGDRVSVANIAVEQNGGGDTTYTYKWGRDSDDYSGGISGADASSYILQEADTGAQIFVYITATNKAGNSGSGESGNTEKIIGKVATITVTPDNNAVNADGNNSVTFTARALDKNNVEVPGEAVRWSLDNAERVEPVSETNLTTERGLATKQVKVLRTGGDVQATAWIDGKQGSGTVKLKGMPEITQLTLKKTSGLKVGDVVEIQDLQVDLHGGGEVNTTYHWGRDSGTVSGGIGGATNPTYKLTEEDAGQIVFIGVTVTNEAGNNGYKSAKTERVIGSVARVKLEASSDSIDADGVNTLTFTATALDKNNVAVPGEKIEWSIDQPQLVSQGKKDPKTNEQGQGQMILTTTSIGGEIVVSAKINQKEDDDKIQLKGSPIVSNARITKTTSGAEMLVDDVLQASASVNPNGGGASTLSYQWLRDGSPISTPTSQSQWTLQAADIGKKISVTVIATNDAGKQGQQTSAPTAVVQSGVPVVTSATIKATRPYWTGNTLTANAGWTENGGGVAVLSYQWRRGGSAISGATSSTYAPVAADIGYTITVTVTVTNSRKKSGSATSSPTLNINSGIPNAYNLTLSKTTGLLVGDQISFTYGVSYNGAFSVNITRQWYRDGVVISGATGSTYVAQAADSGKKITVKVTATNADDTGRSSGSTTQPTDVIQSGTPTVTSVTISKTSNLRQNDELTGYVSATENGGGAVTSSWQWKRDGLWISGATSQNYRVQAADKGKQLSVIATVTNKAGKQDARESARTQAVIYPRMRLSTYSYYYFFNGFKRTYEPRVTVVDENNRPLSGIQVCFAIKRDDWWDGDSNATFREYTESNGRTPVHQITAKLKASVYFNAWICNGGSKPGSTVYMWDDPTDGNVPSSWSGWIDR